MDPLSSNTTDNTNGTNGTNGTTPLSESKLRQALLCIYSVILLLGFIGVALMARTFKSSKSVITTAVINLAIAHSLFLLTVPFRLYFYAVGRWDMGRQTCNAVSGMIHVHMYLAFVFYTVIVILRIRSYYMKESNVRFYRNMHAFLASLAVWIVFVVILPLALNFYGSKESVDDGKCFHFASRMGEGWVKGLNYAVSLLISLTTCTLMALQVNVLVKLFKQKHQDGPAQQEFHAQVKSLLFILVLMVCFVPYHLFRLYYLQHLDLEKVNEVFLTLTALSCIDMLIFLVCWRR